MHPKLQTSDLSDLHDSSDLSEKPTPMPETFLENKGGYRNLRAYKVTESIYDLTWDFVHRFLSKGDRTIDQMIQAARSGKQNIAEGSAASMTSKETEIKLTNVAKASLEELLLDYEDYLRSHRLEQWGKGHMRYERIRIYTQTPDFATDLHERMAQFNDEELANLAITLIHQATYLLRHLLEKQQEQFIKEGGIREQMTRARLNYRNQSPPPTTPTNPPYPKG